MKPPALDITTLNFDTCERLRLVHALLRDFGLEPATATILDVGGYPGYMAQAYPDWRITTVDIFPKGHPPYVQALGSALPFADASFDVVMACDVLEHVPPQYRDAFLVELTRVARRLVVLPGPYDTAGVAYAEMAVRRLLPASSPAQAWLAEHAENGLPNVEKTVEGLLHGSLVATAFPVGSLTAWLLLFAAQAAGEQNHRVQSAVQDFVRVHNEQGAAGGSAPAAGAAYRHTVVAIQDAALVDRLQRIRPADVARETHGEPGALHRYIDALVALLEQILIKSDTTAGPGATDAMALEYVARLETMLAARGVAPPSSSPQAAPADAAERTFARRLRDAWGAFRG